jgi:D-alanyl-D-alanine carboxypeptidase/D-alanyl-D-alanine-endopeptidase (penicillin-binding protein 4)
MSVRLLPRAVKGLALAAAILATNATPALASQPGNLASSSLAAISRADKKPKRATRSAKKAAKPAWTAPVGADALSTAVADALGRHTRSGKWGAIIVSLSRGDTLFAQNADDMLQPASTLKMYTSAVALDRFGPEYRFRTPALRDAAVGPDGSLAGNLYIRGVGDPSLSPRFWHDQNPMDALAQEIAATGLKHIRGDLVGDATAFDDKLVPDGWKASYLGASSGSLSSRAGTRRSSRSNRRPRRSRSRTTCAFLVEAAGGSAPFAKPTAPSAFAARLAPDQARSSTRSSSTIRRCSSPARCALP